MTINIEGVNFEVSSYPDINSGVYVGRKNGIKFKGENIELIVDGSSMIENRNNGVELIKKYLEITKK